MFTPTFDVGEFRKNFPEFSDSSAYPTSTINFWLSLAEQQVRSSIWKTCWVQGVSLYVAHELVLAAQSAKQAKFGGAPGTFGGVANNKTVGSGTVGYDSQSTSEKDAGYWNLTNYGKQFIRLARIFGAGAIQL